MAAFFKSFNLILILLSLLVCVNSWKLCKDITFCNRIRKKPEEGKQKQYTVDLKTLVHHEASIQAQLTTDSSPEPLRFELCIAANSTFRLLIDELKGIRHRVPEALDAQPPPLSMEYDIDSKLGKITVYHDKDRAIIYSKPFKVEFYNGDRLVSVANAENRFIFETGNPEAPAPEVAIAMDVSFLEAHRAYGIPQHAERLSLQSTTLDNSEPYRHFNLDYGHYTIISRESLYGSIPVLYAHGTTLSSGVFWSNSAQTWIDLTVGPNKVDAFFMSETGALEMFVFTGPTLTDTVKQYAKLTGVAPLPQYFALGYHQSRYSYMTQQEVQDVVQKFDENELPVDTMWLDIDYTDDKKYFTWDPTRFPNPTGLLNDLSSTNRTLVAIIDPHFQVNENYFLHKEATLKRYYVQKRKSNGDLEDFVGECWPGDSSYLDFLNPDALQYYASLYSSQKEFNHKNIHLWNDMNEPAVFNDAINENTMAGDLVHYDNWKHRDVHNIYGLYQVIGTHRGLRARTHNVRPFILTRSHFAGIQRYAAIWTGDNKATWGYLQISLPMCLTEALAGVSFCGADVGGFADVPDDELIQRWYQAGAWLPFYRGHSASNVPKREPYLYPADIQHRFRTALHQRYAHLPVWYTLFWEHALTGEPVIRPITYHYPSEADALSIDNEILVGANILAAPVLHPGVSSISVYLPGGESEIWYNIDDNYKKMNGSGYHSINVNLNSVPVFYKGGSIVPRKDILRQTTRATLQDPYTLYICLDNDNQAEGTLYVDDYESFNYEKYKQYLYIHLAYYNNNTLISSNITNEGKYDGAADINQLIIINPPKNIAGANFIGERGNSNQITINYNENGAVLYVQNIAAKLQTTFKLELYKKQEDDGNSATSKMGGFVLIVMVAHLMLI